MKLIIGLIILVVILGGIIVYNFPNIGRFGDDNDSEMNSGKVVSENELEVIIKVDKLMYKNQLIESSNIIELAKSKNLPVTIRYNATSEQATLDVLKNDLKINSIPFQEVYI